MKGLVSFAELQTCSLLKMPCLCSIHMLAIQKQVHRLAAYMLTVKSLYQKLSVAVTACHEQLMLAI